MAAADVVGSVGNNTHMVVYADDEKINQRLLQHALEKIGVEVTCVKDGDEVVPLLQRFSNYKIIVLDETMPNMSGSETAQRIKGLRLNVLLFHYSSEPPSPASSDSQEHLFDEEFHKSSQLEQLKQRILAEIEKIRSKSNTV